MCHSVERGHCAGCCHGIRRRDFLANGCGAAAIAAGGWLASKATAAEPNRRPVRVALVFLSKEGSSWPFPEFDIHAREKEVLDLLKAGCAGVEFEPVAVREPADVQKAAALAEQIDGYLVYCLTLTWPLQRTITTIGKLGKPMLVADEYLGGSGVFLRGYSDLCRQNIPAAGVASTRPEDLVAAARTFADLRPGTTPQAFAERCSRAYRKTFAAAGAQRCVDDPLALPAVGECVRRFQESRFLIVGRGKPGQEQDFLGARGIYVGFEQLQAIYDKVDRDQAAEWAERWITRADKVVEPTREWIEKAGAVYLATLELLRQHGTDTITANCLGGFAQGLLPAYPCLGFMQLMDDGGQGVCEAMPDDTLSMLMARILTGRPGFVSDPVLDTSKNQIVYAHCVGSTKMLGTEREANMFRIRTLHNHDPRGTCAQSFMPEGYMTTSFRTDFTRRKLVIHQAKAVGNLDSPRGCRTQLVGEVRGDIGKLFSEWDHFGWHRVTVYGDVKEPVAEFARALGLEVVQEA